MPDESPGMRPLYIHERAMATIYGLFPAAIVQIPLRAMFALLEQPDCGVGQTIAHIFLGVGCTTPERLSEEFDLAFLLGSGMYGVFYFTFGRSLGHMAVNANIVHYRTGRPMRLWQKAIRSGLHLLIGLAAAWPLPQVPGSGSFWVMMWGVSAALVLLDRRRRRSLYDLAAGTVVVIGEPTEEEPEAARESVFNRALGRLTGRRSAPERG